MSWQEYVDNNMVGTGKVSKAAIIGQQGGTWAASAGLKITPEQEQTIIKAFSTGDPSEFQANGIKVGNAKYMFIRPEGDSFYGKKGAEGICLTKSKQAILIGEYGEGTTAFECNEVVEKLAQYLVSVGF